MFIDYTKIRVSSGRGGDGIVSFKRAKFIAAGGPDGGDGGRGGDVYMIVDEGINTLMDFRYLRNYKAEEGKPGSGDRTHGKSGDDLYIKVPPGTIVRDEETGNVIADLTKNGDVKLIARGGKGGKGNIHFKTATRQIPQFAERGGEPEKFTLILELKLLADIGLVGYPNVGKSTILSMMSSARPKIENYHFTTLEPNLGVVRLDSGKSFVMADIPGLIEGASEGVGLGHEFLRHIERTRLLVHVIDASQTEGRDVVEDFNTINNELSKYSEKLSKRMQIIAANKTDIADCSENLKRLTEEAKKHGYEVFPISAATNKGLKELFYRATELLSQITIDPLEEVVEVVEKEKIDYNAFEIKKENEVYVIEGKGLKRLLNRTNLEDRESLQYFQRSIAKMGVNDKLIEMGAKQGDTVRVEDLEFEFFE